MIIDQQKLISEKKMKQNYLNNWQNYINVVRCSLYWKTCTLMPHMLQMISSEQHKKCKNLTVIHLKESYDIWCCNRAIIRWHTSCLAIMILCSTVFFILLSLSSLIFCFQKDWHFWSVVYKTKRWVSYFNCQRFKHIFNKEVSGYSPWRRRALIIWETQTLEYSLELFNLQC